MFAIGEMVVYGGEGVCRVDSVDTPSLPGIEKGRQYYHLSPLCRTGQVMTPVDTRVLMRRIMTPSEAEGFLASLPALPPEETVESSQRLTKEHFQEVVTSYDCVCMARMIKAVCRKRRWALEHSKKVSQLEERYLKRAEEQLYSELGAALGLSREEMCGYIRRSYPAWPEE